MLSVGSRRIVFVVAIAYLGLAAAPASAGELEPPGSPGSTMKDLDEVAPGTPIDALPYSIDQSGFYYLVSDLTLSGTGSGITINANEVTLDLSGFTLYGTAGAWRGVSIADGVRSVEIRNGSVSGFSIAAIESGPSTIGVRVLDVRVYGSDWGIGLGGSGHLVQRCLVNQPGGQRGIYVQFNSSAVDNIVNRTGGDGIFGQLNSSVKGNRIHMNAGNGINVWDGITIHGNEIGGTPSNGLYIQGSGNIIEHNVVVGGNYGITFDNDGNFYANNRVASVALGAYNLGSTQQRDGGGNWDGTVP